MLAKLESAEFCTKAESLRLVTGANMTLDLYIFGSDKAYKTTKTHEIINKLETKTF